MGCIYYHDDPNGRRYIGGSSYNYCNVVTGRWGKNGINYKDQPFLWAGIRKYGWENFERGCLEDNISNNLWPEREKYYIALYHTYIYDPQYHNGYNLTPGGEQPIGTWPVNEDELLIKNKDLPIKELCKLLPNRSEQAICAHRRKLGLTIDTQADWAPIEIQFLRNNALKLSVDEIAIALGRTVSAVVHKARKLKIAIYDRTWGSTNEQFIREHYKIEGPEFCAEYLHKSLRAVYSKANQLGLHRSTGIKGQQVINKTTGVIYNSVAEAAQLNGLNQRSLQNCLSTNGKYAGQEWEYYKGE